MLRRNFLFYFPFMFIPPPPPPKILSKNYTLQSVCLNFSLKSFNNKTPSITEFFKKFHDSSYYQKNYLYFLETGKLKLSLVKIQYTNCVLLKVFQNKQDAEKYSQLSFNYLKKYKNELQLQEVKYKAISNLRLDFYKFFYTDLSSKEQISKRNIFNLS